MQAAIIEVDAEKAPLASPVFTGDPQAPTPSSTDNDTSIATTAFVKAALPVAATSAEYLANSAPTKMVTPATAWGAAPILNLGPTSNITLNFSNGIDFYAILNGSGAMNNPTNIKNGQKGVIYFVQDGTGGRTITSWGSFWKFPGGVKPVLSTAPNAFDAISYAVLDGTFFIACNFNAGYA